MFSRFFHELELEPVRENCSAPPGFSFSCSSQDSISCVANSSTTAWYRIRRRVEANLSESLDEFRRVELLLCLGFPGYLIVLRDLRLIFEQASLLFLFSRRFSG